MRPALSVNGHHIANLASNIIPDQQQSRAGRDEFYQSLKQQVTDPKKPTFVPKIFQTTNSLNDLLNTLNYVNRPSLDYPALQKIFHTIKEEQGIQAKFCDYPTLQALLQPTHSAIQAEKFRRRQEFKGLGGTDHYAKESSTVVGGGSFTGGSVFQAQPQTNVQPTVAFNMASGTPTVNTFLGGMVNILQTQNVAECRQYLLIEPQFPPIYTQLVQEIQQSFPKGKEKVLENKVDGFLNAALETPWPAFSNFIAVYFTYLRDLNISDLLATFEGLGKLLTACKPAFSNPTFGIVLLDTIVYYAKVFSRVAIGLDAKPELIAHLQQAGSDPEGEGITLPERAANIIREIFLVCAQDRTPSDQPGKWPAALKLANICLRIMFRILKIKVTEQIFRSVTNLLASHPLSSFSRSDRVTFNYHAGRLCFSIRQYYRASQLLEQAYLECHTQAKSQRRAILIHLLIANLLQGRFATLSLLNLRELNDVAPHFRALYLAIKLGDLASFRRLTTIDPTDPASTANFLRRRRVLLQVQESCEMLVWRSLIRRIFLLAGAGPKFIPERNVRVAPNLDLRYVAHIARWLELRALDPQSRSDLGPGKRNTNFVVLNTHQSSIKGDMYVDSDFADLAAEDLVDIFSDSTSEDPLLPTMVSTEVLVASLIAEGLMRGYIAHAQSKFAITGAKDAQSLADAGRAGWPAVWRVFKSQNHIAGAAQLNGLSAGGGRVVRLRGLKTIGSA